MGEVPSPEDENPSKPLDEDEDFPIGPEVFIGSFESMGLSDVLATDEELLALRDWEERNKDALSKMSKPKRRGAHYDALQELRAQRAREQIRQARPDGAAESDSGSGEERKA